MPDKNSGLEREESMLKETEYICPLCGGKVLENAKFFGCENFRTTGCQYQIWKTHFDIPLPKEALHELLTKGYTTQKIDGFYSKKEKVEFASRLLYSRYFNRLKFFKEDLPQNNACS